MIENIYTTSYTTDNYYLGITYKLNNENLIEDQNDNSPFIDSNNNGIPDIIEVIYDGGGV